MVKKFERILKNLMQLWTKKKLIVCEACLLIYMIFVMISISLSLCGHRISHEISSIPSFVDVLLLVCNVLYCYISYKIITIINSIIIEREQKEKDNEAFNNLQKVLSYEEYREVIYSPHLKRYKCNSNISYEDEELKYCEGLLNSDNVTHFAHLDGNYICITSRNNKGNVIGNRTIDATTFCRNYEIVES